MSLGGWLGVLKVLDGIDNPEMCFPRCVLTVGNFDGVHRGHQRILERAREIADRREAPVVALTFEPHPLSVLQPGQGPQRLTTPDMKLDLLRAAGIAFTVVAHSTPEFLHLPAERFIEDILVSRFHPTDWVEGRNFGFGRGRQGDVHTLARFAPRHGYQVHVIDPVQATLADGAHQRVSSSLVRELLLNGRVHLAAEALGRPYLIRGKVVSGAGRGRSLGVPTANLAVEAQLVPGEGVYAGRVAVMGREFRSAVSIGTTPTFAGQARQIEAHLLDFDGDLYSQTLELRFLHRLRSQRPFDSPRALLEQIRADIERTRQENA